MIFWELKLEKTNFTSQKSIKLAKYMKDLIYNNLIIYTLIVAFIGFVISYIFNLYKKKKEKIASNKYTQLYQKKYDEFYKFFNLLDKLNSVEKNAMNKMLSEISNFSERIKQGENNEAKIKTWYSELIEELRINFIKFDELYIKLNNETKPIEFLAGEKVQKTLLQLKKVTKEVFEMSNEITSELIENIKNGNAKIDENKNKQNEILALRISELIEQMKKEMREDLEIS